MAAFVHFVNWLQAVCDQLLCVIPRDAESVQQIGRIFLPHAAS
jgi:hypothetical protein